jgi:transcriptional regulator with XRE-family HTH domain
MLKAPRPTLLSLEAAFGQVLRALREQREMKQVEVSAATGYSQRTVGMIERGEKSPTLRTMEDFATLYNVPLEELIIRTKQLRTVHCQR